MQHADAGADGATALSRRKFAVGALVATAAGAGAGTLLWRALLPPPDPRVEALMERGEDALLLDEPAAKYFDQAAAIDPGNAKAWGLLAYALGSGGTNGPGAVPGPIAQAAERAARTALEIDPKEPNALLAMTILQIEVLDRIEREERLRRILAIDPTNARVMQSLGLLLSGVGRCLDALALTERATQIEPLAPDFARRKAMCLWIVGRVPEADRVVDRAIQLWPSHRLVRMARLMIYAFTGRPQAALALVEEEERRPILLSPEAASVWRASLYAIEERSPSSMAAARKANLDGAKKTPASSAYAILILSALGEVDAAFEVANGFLLGRGSLIVRPRSETKVPTVNGAGWRNTFGLFTPPTKAMRLDPQGAAYYSERGARTHLLARVEQLHGREHCRHAHGSFRRHGKAAGRDRAAVRGEADQERVAPVPLAGELPQPRDQRAQRRYRKHQDEQRSQRSARQPDHANVLKRVRPTGGTLNPPRTYPSSARARPPPRVVAPERATRRPSSASG